jgi:arsenite methyltransferase
MVGGGASLVCAGLGLAYTARGKFRLRDRLLDLVAWRGDEVVLDVGAGAGLLGIGAAHRVPRGRVHCIDLWVGKDLSNNSMDRLRRNASIEGVSERVDARRVDARELHLSDGSVDVVLSTLCLHNLGEVVARKQAALEIVRVLAGRGTVVISDLAGVDELAKWFAAEGIVVQPVRPAAGTFPPQRILVARRD